MCRLRATASEPVAVHMPLAGSYNSTLLVTVSLASDVRPPATSTLPDGNRLELWKKRAKPSGAAAFHVFCAAS